MATTTTLGFRIPEDTDPVADGALAVRNLGQDVDDKIGVTACGSVTIDIATSETTDTAAINFPAGRFSAAPNAVQLTPSHAGYTANVSAITATGCTARITRDATGAAQTVTVYWTAIRQ